MLQTLIKIGAPSFLTFVVVLAIGMLWPTEDVILGGDEDELNSTFSTLVYAVSIAGAIVAGLMSFVTDFLINKKQEPKPGEKTIDDYKAELIRRKKESQKISGQMEDTKNRVLALSSLMVSLSNMAKVVGSTLDPREVIDITMENVIRNMKATKAAIILVDSDTQQLNLSNHHGWDAAEVQAFSCNMGEGIVGYVAEKNVVVDSESLKADPNLSQMTKFTGKKTHICAPLATKDAMLGVLNIEAVEAKKTENKADEMRLVTILTSLAAMAIQNARMFKKTQEWATIDALTGLHNRRAMLDFFEQEIKRADTEGHEVAFFMSDIDHFKGFNDTYGHAIGDFVLAGVAQQYKVITREGDLAGRYGGEEFGQILPKTDKPEAKKVAEQLRKNIENKKFDTEAGELSVTLSVGVASYPEDGNTLEAVRDAADDMLYVCKESGRNKVCVRGFDKIDEVVALKIKVDKLKNTDQDAARELQKELNQLLIERGRADEVKPVEGDSSTVSASPDQTEARPKRAEPNPVPKSDAPSAAPRSRPPGPKKRPGPPGARPSGPSGARPPGPRPPTPPRPGATRPPGAKPGTVGAKPRPRPPGAGAPRPPGSPRPAGAPRPASKKPGPPRPPRPPKPA